MLLFVAHGNKHGPRPRRASQVGERHRVIWYVVNKLILANVPGIGPIKDGLSVHGIYASLPLLDTEIGVDKSHSTVLRRAYEFQGRNAIWSALYLRFPFVVTPSRG